MQMSDKKATIVYMADDDRPKGGFCDRMRAIIWLYSFCKKHGFDFKINFTHPFKLQEYLKPNSYNWIYNEKEYIECNSIKIADFLSLSPFKKYYDADTLYCEDLTTEELETILLKHAQSYAQILVYSYRRVDEILPDYGKLFDELFCFSTELNETLQFHINQMNHSYVGVHFRFQRLLNDIASEVSFGSFVHPVLSINEQKKLCVACVRVIKEIHKENHNHRVLVCSDSTNFMKFIKGFNYDYVYLVEGERKHLEVKGIDKEHILLLLLDYFLLAFAKKNYSVIKRNMYQSTFLFFASLHKKIEFVVLDYRIPVLRRIVSKVKKIIMKIPVLRGIVCNVKKIIIKTPLQYK